MHLPRTPSFRLDGRRALVTGAGRGLGLAAATALAEAGAEVWLAARTANEIEALAMLLREQGYTAKALTLDVTDTQALQHAVAAHGPFEVLVNNAGGNRPKASADVTEADVDALLNLNVKAAYFAAREVAVGLQRAGRRGSIIQMSSQMGHVGAANRSVYCATKHAMEGFNKAMALEFGPSGIRFNTLAPTFVDTPLTHDWLGDRSFRDWALPKIALGRFGELADIMGAVVFLASDASALMTGSSLLLDGGWTAS